MKFEGSVICEVVRYVTLVKPLGELVHYIDSVDLDQFTKKNLNRSKFALSILSIEY